MADIHVAESVVDINYRQYATDSSRRALKQAVLAKNHVTSAEFDSSMEWYGRHLDVYRDVYEKTAEILQERIDKNDVQSLENAQLGISSDSIDVWYLSKNIKIAKSSPSRIVSFKLASDNHSKSGDSYTWRAKFTNNGYGGRWVILAIYADGSMESAQSSVAGDGWQNLIFSSDSTKVLKSISGAMLLDQANTPSIYLDSISLVRKRIDIESYSQRYRQRKYDIR